MTRPPNLYASPTIHVSSNIYCVLVISLQAPFNRACTSIVIRILRPLRANLC